MLLAQRGDVRARAEDLSGVGRKDRREVPGEDRAKIIPACHPAPRDRDKDRSTQPERS